MRNLLPTQVRPLPPAHAQTGSPHSGLSPHSRFFKMLQVTKAHSQRATQVLLRWKWEWSFQASRLWLLCLELWLLNVYLQDEEAWESGQGLGSRSHTFLEIKWAGEPPEVLRVTTWGGERWVHMISSLSSGWGYVSFKYKRYGKPLFLIVKICYFKVMIVRHPSSRQKIKAKKMWVHRWKIGKHLECPWVQERSCAPESTMFPSDFIPQICVEWPRGNWKREQSWLALTRLPAYWGRWTQEKCIQKRFTLLWDGMHRVLWKHEMGVGWGRS